MMRTFLRSKIEGTTVTGTNAGQDGSMSMDPHLMAAADLLLYEKVEIYNVTSGTRFETWVVAGAAGDGELCFNGAEGKLVKPGDRVVITSYCILHAGQTLEHRPKLVFVDEKNRVKALEDGQRRP